MKSSSLFASGGTRPLWQRTRDATLMEDYLYPPSSDGGEEEAMMMGYYFDDYGGASQDNNPLQQSIDRVHSAIVDSSLKARCAVAHGQKGPRCTFLDATRFVSLLLTRVHVNYLHQKKKKSQIKQKVHQVGSSSSSSPRSPRPQSNVYKHDTPSGIVSTDNIPLPSVALRQMFRRSLEHDPEVLGLIRSLYYQLAAAAAGSGLGSCTTMDEQSQGRVQLTIPKEGFTLFIQEVVNSFFGPTLMELLDQIPMATERPKQQQPQQQQQQQQHADPDVDVLGRRQVPPGRRCKVGLPTSIALGEWCAVRTSATGATRLDGSGGSRTMKTTATGKKIHGGGVEETDFIHHVVDLSLLASSEGFSLPVKLKECVLQFLQQVCVPAVREVLTRQRGGEGHQQSTGSAQQVPRPPSAQSNGAVAVADPEMQAEGHLGRHMHPTGVGTTVTKNFAVQRTERGVTNQKRNHYDTVVLPSLTGVHQPHSQFLASLSQQHDPTRLPIMMGGGGAVGEEALALDRAFMANCGTTIGLQPLETDPVAMQANLPQPGRTNQRCPASPRLKWRPPNKKTASSLSQRATRWEEKGNHHPPSHTNERADSGAAENNPSGRSLILSVVNEKTALGRRVRLAELFPIGAKQIPMNL